MCSNFQFNKCLIAGFNVLIELKLRIYWLADFLPVDKINNVRRLLGLMQPSRLVWVSYDLWPNLVWESHRQGIPQSLISGIVHAGSLTGQLTFCAGRSFYRSLYDMFGAYFNSF